MSEPPAEARSEAYTARLKRLSGAWWKRWLDVQAPYRRHLRRLALGYTLDVGCGIGRNLLHLDGHGVGVDTNPHSVETARRRGCCAYTTEKFPNAPEAQPGSFDAMLIAHVLEHMGLAEARELVGSYLPYVRPGGRIVLITPQEAGFRSDAAHVELMDFESLAAIQAAHGLQPLRAYSFPFPRAFGRVFVHNEFVAVGRKPD